MSDLPRPIPITGGPAGSGDRLESWKEIAGYLGREVRTVQGWEKNEGLPIHRHQHAKQGSVYAFKTELDAWREARKGIPEAAPVAAERAPSGPKLRVALLVSAAVAIAILAGVLVWRNRAAQASGQALSSVVVLPFLDMSPQKDQEYFSDGLTEEIIDALSRVPNLRVVARTSAFAFKGKANDIRQIGQQLNVVAVLEGSVRKAGDELRITAQLNKVSDGTHLWSRTYDRKLRDVFAVQQEISQSIASQLRAGDVPRRAATSDLAAYDLYQEGRYFFNQHDPPDSYWKAIDRYQKAIERDPKFALAYSGMADAYAYLAENSVARPKLVMPKAKQAAEQAIALDDNLAEAHTSVGIVKLDYEWDRERAQREFRRALQLNPGSGWVHHWIAHSLEAQGLLEEATTEMRASLALDPLSMPIHWDIANELLAAKKYDETLQFLQRSDELYPNQPIMAYERAEAYGRKGDPLKASRVMDALRTAHPELMKEPTFMTMQGLAAVWAGRRSEAQGILSELERLHQTQYVEPFTILELCSKLNDHKSLMTWLQRAYDERSTIYLYLPLVSEMYDNDPDVKAFLAKHR